MNKSAMKALFKRDKYYNLFYSGILLLFFVGVLVNFIGDLSKDYRYEFRSYNYSFFMEFISVIIIFQFFRWVYFEGNSLETEILPISIKDRILYDFITGTFFILLWNIWNLILEYISTRIRSAKAIETLNSLDFPDFYISHYKMSYLGKYIISNSINAFLSMMLIYSIFLLIKLVCNNVAAGVILYISLVNSVVVILEIICGKFENLLYESLLLLFWILIAYCIKHRDISKGKIYLFNGAKIYQLLFISLLIVWGTYNTVESIQIVKIICGLVVGTLIFVGLFYVTRNKA